MQGTPVYNKWLREGRKECNFYNMPILSVEFISQLQGNRNQLDTVNMIDGVICFTNWIWDVVIRKMSRYD